MTRMNFVFIRISFGKKEKFIIKTNRCIGLLVFARFNDDHGGFKSNVRIKLPLQVKKGNGTHSSMVKVRASQSVKAIIKVVFALVCSRQTISSETCMANEVMSITCLISYFITCKKNKKHFIYQWSTINEV